MKQNKNVLLIIKKGNVFYDVENSKVQSNIRHEAAVAR